MIDIKATLLNAEMSQAEFGRLVKKPRQQVNKWYSGKFNPSPLMEKEILRILRRKKIEIIEK